MHVKGLMSHTSLSSVAPAFLYMSVTNLKLKKKIKKMHTTVI